MGSSVNIGGRDFNISQVKTMKTHKDGVSTVIGDIDEEFSVVKDTVASILAENAASATGVYFISGLDYKNITTEICVNNIEEYWVNPRNSNSIIIKFTNNTHAAFTGFTSAELDIELAKIGTIEVIAGGDMSDEAIKIAYERNTDTNAFTDTYKDLLDNPPAAEGMSDAEVKAAYERNEDTNALTDQRVLDYDAAKTHADSTHGAMIPASGKSPASSYESYSEGTSRFSVLASDGWPYDGMLINTRTDTEDYQELNTGADGIVSRSWNTGTGDWTTWSAQIAQSQNRNIFISDQGPDPEVGVDGDIWFQFY